MTSATWLDRTIAWFSPARGVQRANARAVLSLSYEAGKTGRRNDGWVVVPGASADADIARSHALIRDRARSLVQNNPHAGKGLSVLVANKVGVGIGIKAAAVKVGGKRPNQKRNARAHALWTRWAESCDVTGRLTIHALQSLVERTRSESGEALVRFTPTKVTERGDVPFRLQVLEPDFLDSSKMSVSADGETVTRYGIVYRDSRPIGYWLFDAHPGDNTPLPQRRGYTSRLHDAADVLHIFKPLRAGQTRGITDFASVLLRLRALDDYDDAELMRKKIAACLAAFVTTPQGLPGGALAPTSTDADGRRIEQFSPGMVAYIKNGERVDVADPKPSTDYEPFTKVQLRAVAAGLDMPYELLTGDLSEVTYTSHRGGLVQFRGMIEAEQEQILIPQLCRPIWQRFLAEARGVDGSIDPETPATFSPPRFALLDPAKEGAAMIQAIQGGLQSWPEMMRREGYDPDEVLDEIEAWQKDLTKRGIVITSDARQNAGPASQRFEPPEKGGDDDGGKPAPTDDDGDDSADEEKEAA